jgi:hypothetical protein
MALSLVVDHTDKLVSAILSLDTRPRFGTAYLHRYDKYRIISCLVSSPKHHCLRPPLR